MHVYNSKQLTEHVVLTLWNLTFTVGQENEDEKAESKCNFIKQNKEDNPRNKKKATGENMWQFKQDKTKSWTERGQDMHQIMRAKTRDKCEKSMSKSVNMVTNEKWELGSKVIQTKSPWKLKQNWTEPLH